MGKIAVFPQDRVRRRSAPSAHIEQLEHQILALLRILKHRDSPELVAEILKLRDEIWRIEAEEAVGAEIMP
jgi:hypothetical protein